MNEKELKRMMKYVRTANTEMGSVDTRLGNIEGQLNEALPEIKKDVGAIFNKFDKLPCIDSTTRIAKLETKISMITKSRWIIFTASVSGLVYIITRSFS